MLMLLAAALLVVTGCKKDDKDLNASGEKMTFTASIDNGNDKTSITINGNEGSLNWTVGDAVNINGKGFTATSVDNDGKATFEGETVTPDVDGKYKAIFPANLYHGGNYVLPATQTYAPGNNLSGVNPMYAESTTTELEFQSICALLKLNLKSDNRTIKKIEVSADQALSGPFTIDGNVAKLTSPNAQAGVTLDCGVGVAINNSTGTDFFIAIPAGEYTHLTFKAIDNNNNVGYYTSEGKVTVSANNFYTSEQTIVFLDHDYLCFTAEQDNSTVEIFQPDGLHDINISYYYKNGWQGFNVLHEFEEDYEEQHPGYEPTTVRLQKGEKVYFKGNNPNGLSTQPYNYSFKLRGKLAASGNIMSLISEDCSKTEIPCEFCFKKLFSDDDEYPNPALTTAPALPAETLTTTCYYYMFAGCSALTTAPALPATELKAGCYSGMFSDCSSLTTAPTLPATELKPQCYTLMFERCSSLNSITMLATDISANACLYNWTWCVAASGTLWSSYDSENAPTTLSSSVPAGWTIKKYEGSK